MNERQQLEQAIAFQESLRGTVEDALIDLTISALRRQLEQLQPAPEHQRKLVTILFADIVESTNLIRDLDPEDNLEIIDHALKRLSAPIEQFGGHVTRYMGDGFKAVFGKPIAHENDPEMAIRAGLSILEIARDYAEVLREAHNIPNFQMRWWSNAIFSGRTACIDYVIIKKSVIYSSVKNPYLPPGIIIQVSP